MSTSIQSSTAVTLQDDQASPQEPELPPPEVVPVVAPPSLKEVQQAVQEASEQVEGRGAEEVLKELLERVVEAALGHVEGGGEGKADEEAAVQGAVEEDVLVAENGETESDTEAEVVEPTVEEGEVGGEDLGAKGGDAGVGEEQEVAEVDAFEHVAEEGKGVGEGEAEAAAGSVQETTAVVETGGGEAEGGEVIDEPLDIEVSQEVVEETLAAPEETGGYLVVEEAGVEDNGERVVLSEEKGAAEPETQEVEETPAVVEVAAGGEPEQETVAEPDPSLAVAEVEQIGDVWGKEQALEEEAQVDDNYEMETTQSVVGEPVVVEEEEEEEVNLVKDAEGPQVEDKQGHVAAEGGAAEEVEAEGAEVGGAEEGESVIREESVVLVNEGLGDRQAGEEEQIASETSHGGEKEDQGEKWFQ